MVRHVSGNHDWVCEGQPLKFFTLLLMQEVTGIYVNNFDSALNTKNGFPVFATVVEANYVTKKQDLFSALRLTDEDKSDIEKLSKDPRIGQRVWTLNVSIL